MTTPNQVAQARALAKIFEDMDGVLTAHVDDWDNDGGFNIFVTVVLPDVPEWPRPRLKRHAYLTRLQSVIRKVGAHYQWHTGPRMQYERQNGVRCRKGYDRNNYKFSIRFDDHTPEPPSKTPKYTCRADMPDGLR